MSKLISVGTAYTGSSATNETVNIFEAESRTKQTEQRERKVRGMCTNAAAFGEQNYEERKGLFGSLLGRTPKG